MFGFIPLVVIAAVAPAPVARTTPRTLHATVTVSGPGGHAKGLVWERADMSRLSLHEHGKLMNYVDRDGRSYVWAEGEATGRWFAKTSSEFVTLLAIMRNEGTLVRTGMRHGVAIEELHAIFVDGTDARAILRSSDGAPIEWIDEGTGVRERFEILSIDDDLPDDVFALPPGVKFNRGR